MDHVQMLGSVRDQELQRGFVNLLHRYADDRQMLNHRLRVIPLVGVDFVDRLFRKYLHAGIRANREHAGSNLFHPRAVDRVRGQETLLREVVEPRAVEQDAGCVDRQRTLDFADDGRHTPGRDAEAATLAHEGFDCRAVLVGDALVVVKERSVQITIEIIAVKGAHDFLLKRLTQPVKRRRNAFILNDEAVKGNRFGEIRQVFYTI